MDRPVPACTWYMRPGFGASVRPTIVAGKRDEGAIAPHAGSGRTFWARHPAIEPGGPWGVGHGNGDGLSFRGGSGRSIPDPDHEPSNWSSANRPGDRRGGSSHRIHPRHGRPPVSGGDLAFPASQAVLPRRSGVACARRIIPRRSRSAWTTRAARDQVRVVVDGAGHPVDVRRLEGRDLAERVVVELAERHDERLGLSQGRRRPPAEAADPVADGGPVGVDARSGSRPTMLVGFGGWPRSGVRAGAIADRLVARLVDAAHVDAAGHRAGRLRWRRSAALGA